MESEGAKRKRIKPQIACFKNLLVLFAIVDVSRCAVDPGRPRIRVPRSKGGDGESDIHDLLVVKRNEKKEKKINKLARSIREKLLTRNATSYPQYSWDKPRKKEDEDINSLSGEVDDHDGSSSSSSGTVDVEVARKYWKKTFEDIKDLVVYTGVEKKSDRKYLLDRWKLLLDPSFETRNEYYADIKEDEEDEEDSRIVKDENDESLWPLSTMTLSRFDGFASWERRLQQWAEDASEYLSRQSQISTDSTYPMSSYGVPTFSTLKVDTPTLNKAMNQTRVTKSKQQTKRIKPASSSPSFTPRPITPEEPILPHTSISDKSKNIWIITTASLPWMTGTAVNPLLRAAYLTAGRSKEGGSVTIMLPWLERPDDQERIYGADMTFDRMEDQEAYIRKWLRESANLKEAADEIRIRWYTAWQERAENSVYSMGDITAEIPSEEVDICVLEEPEHLNWYRAPGESWTSKFPHVVGVVHTNYFVYAQEQPAAFIRAPAMRLLCSWMCRAHCHRVIKLSGTLGRFAPEKELVENVHGVRRTFLDAGQVVRDRLLLSSSSGEQEDPIFGANAQPTVYFLGKMLWSKGLTSLMELVKYAEESAGLKVRVDMYGGGPNKEEAEDKVQSLGLDMPFHGPVDHAQLAFTHKIFVNPSTSEVLCTAVAEALAMGKFVVLPSHPSNDFFAQFPNCLPYSNKEEFVGNLYYALTHSPEPLTEEYSYALSWEAATERFERAGSVSVAEAEAMANLTSVNALEIDLPPLIDDEEQRKQLASTIKSTRVLYRHFRSLLGKEIQQQSNILYLPKALQKQILSELDNTLNLDPSSLLLQGGDYSSTKLTLNFSPAELDRKLLKFYETASKSPGGDVLRVIGGGTTVGYQNLYLKEQARKERRGSGSGGFSRDAEWRFVNTTSLSLPLFDAEDGPEFGSSGGATPTQWVKKALRQNLPLVQKNGFVTSRSAMRTMRDRKTNMKMRMTASTSVSEEISRQRGIPFLPKSRFTRSIPPCLRHIPVLI